MNATDNSQVTKLALDRIQETVLDFWYPPEGLLGEGPDGTDVAQARVEAERILSMYGPEPSLSLIIHYLTSADED